MDLGLKGKKVIINGGSRGLGLAALEIFAAEGCDIAFFSRDAKRVDATINKLKAGGGQVVGDAFDMNDLDAYQAWLKGAAEKLGGCDIFIHNASSSGAQGTMDWELTFRLDMMGAVKGCETLEPALEAAGGGSVILMSSTAAVETFIYPQAFNAIKAAILTYGKQLSQLWAPKNIRVNMVSPGPISYPGGNWETIKGAMPELYEKTLSEMPLGRFGAPEDVARAVVFLSSPAASYITGTNVVIDGGYTKRVQF
ncbi:SDR family NAD(P)-dependent oxidoreductase [Azoarcus sp. KH32C]|uniref:SDR family NAD(P)-dependent oxidoreductase n=1 Tax=Azoarcus sp. KH32C TaxID=748247 RepID=UPI000238629E|nr:SDR family oxidoreductase [Azoarcus sp. KH32C]BAL24605.1 short-chain dehydrogenase/reductase SDR [Azoarcus sp. KH32C]